MDNPHSSWINFKGTWVTNILLVIFLKLLFSIIPGVSAEASWTMTVVVYNLGTFIFFHWIVGSPFDTNQGEFRALTFWEQIDEGSQFTPTKKFMTVFPIILFLLSCHYTHYHFTTFLINFSTLLLVLIAKLPSLHKLRIFGINNFETIICLRFACLFN